MKKITTIFKINWVDHQRGDVTREVNPENQWVLDGEGVATRKWDGTAIMRKGAFLYKRYDRKMNPKTGEYKTPKEAWIACQDPDPITHHWTGWLWVNPSDPENKWIVQAFEEDADSIFDNGTYELIGPQINGNPEHVDRLIFKKHGDVVYDIPKEKRNFDDLRQFLIDNEIEGIVFHHPDGRMAKLKRRDFGLKWAKKEVPV